MKKVIDGGCASQYYKISLILSGENCCGIAVFREQALAKTQD